MSEPLSSLASVIQIAGSATESIKVLLTFFYQFRHAPAQVHQWLTMLESLRSTLSSLQQCGRNCNSRYRFSQHFQQRLRSCVDQLQVCTRKIARIDAELKQVELNDTKKWNYKAKRSWGRAKWAIIGDYKMKKIVEMMDLYQFEFVIEMLRMLL